MDPESLVERIKRLEIGLPGEDEFSMILCWLGKCQLVHKLNQHQNPPSSKSYYRVPDLMVVFDYNNHKIAVLIEVKTTKPNKLSWTSEYFEGLQQYGQQLGLPVLVAWKCRQLGLWTLFELRHFHRPRQNFKLTFETAMKQNLMGLLAGDFSVRLKSGVGLHFKMHKEAKLSEERDGSALQEMWRLRIEDAYFTNSDSDRIKQLGPGLWPLFLSAPFQDQTKIEETHIHQSFIIPPDEPIQYAQRALAILLEFSKEDEHPLNWREILLNHRIPVECVTLRKAAEKGIPRRMVRYVFDQVPVTRPDFLGEH